MGDMVFAGQIGLKPALLIINPVSGKRAALRFVPQIVRVLMDAGYLVTTVITQKRGDATQFAATIGKNYQLVCCVGGDGTLNETVTGLAIDGASVPLGYIPCGSTNDFAATHGISGEIMTAARNICAGNTRRFDIGRFGMQYFTYVAAFGAFSWLSYTTDQNMKNLLGHTAYILDCVKDLPKIKPLHVRLVSDGRIYEDDYIFGAVCNSTSIAGVFQLPDSEVDTCDGRFEVLLIKMPATLPELDLIVRALLSQKYDECPFIEFFHSRFIEVFNPPDLEWSLDGECSGRFDHAVIEPMCGFLQLQG